MRRCTYVLALIVFSNGSFGRAEVVIDTVTVGNPGNPNDTHGVGFGGVAYTYEMGAFEVTAGQYAEFLNAVATSDTYDLYHANMAQGFYGCEIRQIGSPGQYTYVVDADGDNVEDTDWVNRPVNFLSWGDAARFANWLHNGQPLGGQGPGTTEDGSYALYGAMTATELHSVTRTPHATWVIPTEDEWYKAAYHLNNGVTGDYVEYPTGSDTQPPAEAPPGTDMTNGSANCLDGAWVDGTYYRTEVGAYDAKPSDSTYGTFDQGGNVAEWTEQRFRSPNRSIRGGSFYNPGGSMSASYLNGVSTIIQLGAIGFRVAKVPEPIDPDSDGDVDVRDFKRFQACFGEIDLACESLDFNDTSVVDLDDYALFHQGITGPLPR